MNAKQIRILWIGIIIVVIMGLFPPVVGSYALRERGFRVYAGPRYDFLLTSSGAGLKITGDMKPVDAEYVSRNRRNWIDVIDFQKLLIQWSIVAAIAAGAIVSIKDTEAKPK
jgi:hypothetical protein